MGELWRRIWYLLNRSRFERELEAEMEAHRAMKGDAGPRFGNMRRLREDARDEWGWAWLDALAQDLRFAWCLLWRSPSFTLTAIAVLSLGVGVNLAAYLSSRVCSCAASRASRGCHSGSTISRRSSPILVSRATASRRRQRRRIGRPPRHASARSPA